MSRGNTLFAATFEETLEGKLDLVFRLVFDGKFIRDERRRFRFGNGCRVCDRRRIDRLGHPPRNAAEDQERRGGESHRERSVGRRRRLLLRELAETCRDRVRVVGA